MPRSGSTANTRTYNIRVPGVGLENMSLEPYSSTLHRLIEQVRLYRADSIANRYRSRIREHYYSYLDQHAGLVICVG